jgi:hypothetical protein
MTAATWLPLVALLAVVAFVAYALTGADLCLWCRGP